MNNLEAMLHSDAQHWNHAQPDLPDFDLALDNAIQQQQTKTSPRWLWPAVAATVVAILAAGLTLASTLTRGNTTSSPVAGLSIPAGYTKIWTYHGLAINTPASFKHNAVVCQTPTADTVIDLDQYLQCLPYLPAFTSVTFTNYQTRPPPIPLTHAASHSIYIGGLAATQTTGQATHNYSSPPTTLHEVITTIPALHIQVQIASPDLARAVAIARTLRRP